MTREHITVKSGAITKPLLAARSDGEDLSTLSYPLGVTVKVDGIRCLKLDGRAVSRTFKPLPNDHIRTLIERHLPDGVDMEVTSGSTFQECSGNIMRKDGTPDFTVSIIDYVDEGLAIPYRERMRRAEGYVETNLRDVSGPTRVPFKLTVLMPVIAHSWSDVTRLEAEALAEGHEGIMLRRLDAPYKCGRSTFREGILVKVKQFLDTSAVILDVEELQHNENERQRDAFGRTKRSTAQGGKTAGGTLGALIVKGIEGVYKDVTWNVGTGFTAEQRADLWKRRKEIVGQFVTVKFFPTGSDEKPRFPTFVGLRHPDDM